jgi:hypothetical protein
VVADIIRAYDSTPPPALPDAIAGYLARLNVTSTYWPGDTEIREKLRTEQVFRRFKKARSRMLMEAIEDAYRKGTNQPQVPRRGYPMEHILPQKWPAHWPVEGLEAEEARAEHVHRLGNLTLLTTSLNSKVSNGPWDKKRVALQAHDTLLLNSRLLAVFAVWEESSINARTESLIDTLLDVWRVPAGHKGEVVDPHQKDAGWIQIKHLVGAGLLEPGTVLTSRQGTWGVRTALVTPDGRLEVVDGATFDTRRAQGTTSAAGLQTAGASGVCQMVDGWRTCELSTRARNQARPQAVSTGRRCTRSSKRSQRVIGRPTATLLTR